MVHKRAWELTTEDKEAKIRAPSAAKKRRLEAHARLRHGSILDRGHKLALEHIAAERKRLDSEAFYHGRR